jgi:hypothetical protein
MKAAAYSLTQLAADPKYVGGKIGMLAVLHTWTRAMVFHPHAHFLVPGGGVSPDGDFWLSARNNYLVPVKALSSIFRAKFMEMARKALPDQTFEEALWQKDWVVYCKPSVQGAEKVVQYLARYVHRIAITNNRVLSVHDGKVTFRYKASPKKSQNPRWMTMTLPAMEFVRRFLQHVLPRGFHKVRYYGLLSPANRHPLARIRLSLANEAQDVQASEADGVISAGGHRRICRRCHAGQMIVVAILPRGWRPMPARSPP